MVLQFVVKIVTYCFYRLLLREARYCYGKSCVRPSVCAVGGLHHIHWDTYKVILRINRVILPLGEWWSKDSDKMRVNLSNLRMNEGGLSKNHVNQPVTHLKNIARYDHHPAA